MLNRKFFEAIVEVKVARVHALWTSKIETKITPPVKVAGRLIRPESKIQASRDSLAVTGIVAALASLNKKNRGELTDIAIRYGATKPRLLLRCRQDLAAGLRGDPELRVSQWMRGRLNRWLPFWDLTIEEVAEKEHSQQALYAFGMRTLVEPQNDDDPETILAPSAISVIDRDGDIIHSPLTPTYEEAIA